MHVTDLYPSVYHKDISQTVLILHSEIRFFQKPFPVDTTLSSGQMMGFVMSTICYLTNLFNFAFIQ